MMQRDWSKIMMRIVVVAVSSSLLVLLGGNIISHAGENLVKNPGVEIDGAKSSDNKKGEIIISELNDLSRWEVNCDNPATKVELFVEKYDPKWPGGCLKLKYEGEGAIHLTFTKDKPFGGLPKLFRVWTRAECPMNTPIELKGVFSSSSGQTKKIELARYFQPYWMQNACDFRFKKQITGGDEKIAYQDGLAGEDAVNGFYALAGFDIILQGETKGAFYFARASAWGDNLDTSDRLFFPDPKRKIGLPGYNLINDYSFEEGSLSWWGYGTARIDSSEAHSGKQSLQMSKVNSEEYRNERLQKPNFAGMHFKAAKIKVSAWSKAKDVTGITDNNYGLTFSASYADGSSGNYKYIPFDVGTHDWKYYEFIGEPDPDKEISSVRIAVAFSGKHTGTIWFDDINCMVISEEPEEKTKGPLLTPLVKNSMNIPDRWKLKEICGKDFYFDAPNGIIGGSISHIDLSMIGPLNAGFKIALREIEVYSAGKNIALETKPQVEVEFGQVQNIERINNGNKEESPCVSEPAAPVPLQGSFTLVFDRPQNINKVVVEHGQKTEGKNCYIAESFHLESRQNNAWVTIPSTRKEGNKDLSTTFSFPAIKTDGIRLVIDRESDGNNQLIDDILQRNFGKNIMMTAVNPYPLSAGSIYATPRWDVTHLKRFNRELERIYGKDWFGYMESEWDNCIATYFGLANQGITSEGKTFKVGLPKTKGEAYQITKDLFSAIRDKVGEKRWGMSTWTFNHYDMQFGSSLGCTELTAAVGQYPIQLAFTRGAARQYQKPWGIYMAHFMGNWNQLRYDVPEPGLIKKYSCYGGGPDCGSTVSLEKRIHYLSYFSGANVIWQETPPLWSDLDADGRIELSPWGQAIQGWYNFTRRHPERGITYAPIAIMLDYLHGWMPRQEKTWGIIPCQEEDFMVNNFMYTLWPLNLVTLIDQPNFALCNANEEHPWGDIFDVIVPNFPGNILSNKTLSDYRVLFAVGGLTLSDDFVRELKEYVKNGGTLVLNVSQAKKDILGENFLGVKIEDETGISTKIKCLEENKEIPSDAFITQKVKSTTAKVIATDESGHPLILVNNFGKGNVILTTPPYLTRLDTERKMIPLASYLMRRLTYEVLPFQVHGDIEYIINRNEKGWVVGLINNNGVYKNCDMRNPGWEVKGCPSFFDGVYNPTIVDTSKDSEVVINLPENIYGAVELVNELPLPVTKVKENKELKLVVPAGDVRVIQLFVD